MSGSQDKILRAIGMSLHNWSHVELAMADLFTAMMGPSDAIRANAAFAAVISFDARLAMLDRLIAMSHLTNLEEAIWVKVSQRLSKSYKRRHKLAHFTLAQNPDGEIIIRPFLTRDYLRHKSPPALDIKQVRDIGEAFREFSPAIGWFAKTVIRRRMPHQEPHLPPLEEPPLVARLRELAIQSPAERTPPHQSEAQ